MQLYVHIGEARRAPYRWLQKYLLLSLASLAAASSARAAAPTEPPPSSVEVEQSAGGLTIRAKAAALVDVLDAIAEKGGFEVKVVQHPERPPVDVEIHDASVEDALRRVLRRRNYTLILRGGEEPGIESLMVLSPPRPAEEERKRLEAEARNRSLAEARRVAAQARTQARARFGQVQARVQSTR